MPSTTMFGPRSTPQFQTVTSAFYHHASTQPDTVAVRDLASIDPRVVTYGELAQKAARLARKLRQLGVIPGDRVPLVVRRGTDMLVGIFAILSCGAQYVPLDGSVVPDSTLSHIATQSGNTAVVLRSTRYRVDDLGFTNIVVIEEEEQSEEDVYSQGLAIDDLAEPDRGCYVIYTSGTTGTAKGIDVSHRNVSNLIFNAPGNLGITAGTRVGQVLNIGYDLAAWEILGCLCNGGTLIIRGSNWLKALRQIDVLICPPSVLSRYQPHDVPNIKVVATAGEASSQNLADVWAAHGTYYNCWGPMEATMVNTMHHHQAGGKISVGKPTPNNNVYILDSDLNPVEPGEPGQLWSGGAGVSGGYVGMAEKTAEAYLPDPFANNGSFMFNTGDVGRLNDSGSICMIGRQDDQIKIKGFRIELDGVTASLSACPSVERAAVLLVNHEMHAFVSPETVDLAEVKDHMRHCQPYYAVPSQFHLVPSLPLSENGKIDKTALKAQALSYVADPESAVVSTVVSPSSSTTTLGLADPITGSEISSQSGDSVEDEKVKAKAIDLPSVAPHDMDAAVPDKVMGKRVRGLRFRVGIIYRRLFTVIGVLNIGALIALLATDIQRPWLSNMTAINLLLAVLMRQEFVINGLYNVFCNIPTSWPLWFRVKCAKIYHFGGIHSGSAVASALWLLAANISDLVCEGGATCNASWGYQSPATKSISWILIACYILNLTMAYPTLRQKYHNQFEWVHRFVGWTMLGLFWVQVVLSTNDTRGDKTLGQAILVTPPIWILVAATLSIASSWFWLRKVPVKAEKLSDHAVRLHFDYAVPVNGAFARLSYTPLTEWHSFATIAAPEAVNGYPRGYSMVVSNAGDWTRKTIANPPEKIWIRGVPTSGVMRIATLFSRIVLIGTGSGIGPLLGHIQQNPADIQLIWSTKDPEKTFGEAMCNTIRRRVPNAIIHDTKLLGRPDLVKMAFNAAKIHNAEAVVIIANEKITKKVVYGLEARGINAFGAIWDS